jgi:Rod binding domain-containing protein
MLYVNPLDLQVNRLQSGPEDSQKRRLALREMEHSFLFTLLQEMRKAMADESQPASRETEMYTEMLDDALSSEMARTGQLGLAKQIERQLDSQLKKSAGAADDQKGGSNGSYYGDMPGRFVDESDEVGFGRCVSSFGKGLSKHLCEPSATGRCEL